MHVNDYNIGNFIQIPDQTQQSPAFNCLHYLKTGFIEGEVDSTDSSSPSESVSQVNNQGKEQPLS